MHFPHRVLPQNSNFRILALILPAAMPPRTAKPPPPPPEVVVEYARSGRTACRACGATIAVGVLRLGLSTKDPRGWDAVKWHHLGCFSAQPLGPAEAVKGFDSLKESDQEVLKKLEVDSAGFTGNELSQPAKATSSVEKVVSVNKNKVKVIAEYAKSSRSSCKACGEVITAGCPRLGFCNKDKDTTRGFDFKIWYHLACFPVGTMSLATEEIDGFSSMKDCDKEAIAKLEADKELSQPAKATSSVEKVVSVNKDKAKVIAEYAKSSRSSCKACGEVITAGCPRLGFCNKDKDTTRGFDFKIWYHLACFPVGTMSLATEEIDGFSSMKDCDKEAIAKLEADKEDNITNGNSGTTKSDGRNSKKPKIHDGDDVGSGQPMGMSSEALKFSEAANKSDLEIGFSLSDIKDTYKEATLAPKWKAFKTVIFRERDDDLHDSEKIAAFDFDGCLANTSVKRTGPDAWSLMYPSIPERLQGLHDDGYKLVIFTNESNIERWKNKRQQAVDSKIGRLNNFINTVKVPIQVFIACGLGKSKDQTDDPFRKPKPGMWRLMEKHFNSGIAINMEQSFYVGDAAGRANDHSDADIKFAKDIGLKFHVPEDFFGATKVSKS